MLLLWCPFAHMSQVFIVTFTTLCQSWLSFNFQHLCHVYGGHIYPIISIFFVAGMLKRGLCQTQAQSSHSH